MLRSVFSASWKIRWTCIAVCSALRIRWWKCVFTLCVCVCVCVCVCMWRVCVCVCVCICIHACVCMYRKVPLIRLLSNFCLWSDFCVYNEVRCWTDACVTIIVIVLVLFGANHTIIQPVYVSSQFVLPICCINWHCCASSQYHHVLIWEVIVQKAASDLQLAPSLRVLICIRVCVFFCYCVHWFLFLFWQFRELTQLVDKFISPIVDKLLRATPEVRWLH